MSALSLYAVVAICGAVVLVLEILGTRILGPFYGVSLYLWSALISVTLASLSAGYWLGGRWADRRPEAGFLARLILIAGLWTAAIPWLRQPLLAEKSAETERRIPRVLEGWPVVIQVTGPIRALPDSR